MHSFPLFYRKMHYLVYLRVVSLLGENSEPAKGAAMLMSLVAYVNFLTVCQAVGRMTFATEFLISSEVSLAVFGGLALVHVVGLTSPETLSKTQEKLQDGEVGLLTKVLLPIYIYGSLVLLWVLSP